MALRLNDFVVCGEIINSRNYSTHGWIRLKGREQPLLLQLTGNCDPDLAGKRFRFEVRVPDGQDADAFADEKVDLPKLAWQQIGPTGTMTADRRVKVSDCPPAELYRRAELGELPPTEWKQCLYLEWFSQNGRVVLEVADPILEFYDAYDTETENVNASDIDADDDSEPDTEMEFELPPNDESPENELGITEFRVDENGDVHISEETFSDDDGNAQEQINPDDPYGLIPEELQRQFEAESWKTDQEIVSDEDKPESIRELELMDNLISNSDGELIGSLFDSPMRFPLPDQLDDNQVEQQLKTLLGQLALYGIALDVCEHYTPRDTYRLLLEEICTEERAYPELRETQWIQHFMTSEFCEKCDAELERDFEEFDTKFDLPHDDDSPQPDSFDDDVPY